MLLKYIEFILFGNLLLCDDVYETHTFIILADNCGRGVICHCGMSRGHCCILGTPLCILTVDYTFKSIPYLISHKDIIIISNLHQL